MESDDLEQNQRTEYLAWDQPLRNVWPLSKQPAEVFTCIITRDLPGPETK